MPKSVVVVESPAKAKTINKYLGNDFVVLASYGHVRDLIPKNGAVETDNDFKMNYENVTRNAKHIKAIADALKAGDALILATDQDREGEAISWHIYEIMKARRLLKDKDVRRVVFNEITKSAIQKAMANPRDISMDLVHAQQARRALDYLVGFNLSPLLWRKVQPKLSAGRVQSPALRLICEREAEIEAFVSQEYWTIKAEATEAKQTFAAKLTHLRGDKLKQFALNTEQLAHDAKKALLAAASGTLDVAHVEKKARKRNPVAPFITSTLQQEASRKLGFGAQRTMRLAQGLYEGINLGAETVGLITYMRTDSVSLANEAVNAIRSFVKDKYGEDYVPNQPNSYKSKSKNAQEAHEAIRPTNISAQYAPDALKGKLEHDQWRLYDLIWKRALASQMIYATMDTVTVDLHAGSAGVFRATGSTIKHPGFMVLYLESTDNDKADAEKADSAQTSKDDSLLPEMKVGQNVTLRDIIATQHFTEPPPRYTEASLVKVLEEHDIGRPSTYASIIQTLLAREYVLQDQKRFVPTQIGKIVNLFLTKHFEQVVDYDFTAHLEDELDAVARGEKDWLPLLESYWEPFHATVEAKKDVPREEVMQSREIGTDPKTGKPVSVRYGRFGPFVQIGTKDDEEKPQFASLLGDMKFDEVTLDEALELFKLPMNLGEYEGEEVMVNDGRYGPYVKHGDKYISLGRGVNPLTVDYEQAVDAIVEKQKADAPIAEHDGLPVQKGVGRFGPYLKWNGLFINVNKKYDFDNLTPDDIVELIEEKKRKEIDKIIHKWEDEGISVEKARWGRFNVIQGKIKVELPKTFDAQSLTLEDCQKMIEEAKPKKKTTKKAASKSTSKKGTAKKAAKKTTAKKPATKKTAAKSSTSKASKTTKK